MKTDGVKYRVLLPAGLALTLALSGGASILAEPEVTQGVPKGGPDKTFKSPMIMKTKLLSALPEHLGQFLSSAEFQSFICDNVRLKLLETHVQVWDKTVDVGINVTTYTELGIDKKVDILVELLGPDSVIATGMLGPFSSEEGKRGHRRLMLRVPLDQWPTAEVPSLRMTMNVVDDP
ncbi:MAG TPA: hypothetical protein VGQ67_01020 [Candidatus Polarisedimenticolia bacterium]|jgi:hypothetical protein|nr:hypothetical protein [Candidatus Polarisedimenticolia bacterium]